MAEKLPSNCQKRMEGDKEQGLEKKKGKAEGKKGRREEMRKGEKE